VVERYPIEGHSLIGIFYPQNSILQISGIWNHLTFHAGGYTLTLAQIEHEILRKSFDDPRIHFAIVCASRSCPVLRSEPYRFHRLDRQLEEQTRRFINDPTRGVRWDADTHLLYISNIFKWFKEDFHRESASGECLEAYSTTHPILPFIRPYLRNDSITQALDQDRSIRMEWLPYDWRLNDSADRQQRPNDVARKNRSRRCGLVTPFNLDRPFHFEDTFPPYMLWR
jgi:hypothetical protein